MRVDPSLVTHLTAVASAASAAAPGDKGVFGAALAAASAGGRSAPRAGGSASTPAAHENGTSDAPARAPQRLAARRDDTHARPANAPRGERYADVAGHAYDEIIDGPRNGMFINRSGNERDGQAFILVRRDGRQFHIYGSGKDRLVVEVKHHRPPAGADARHDRAHAPSTGGTPAGPDAPTRPRDREPKAPIVGAAAPAGAWSAVPAWARARAAGS